MHAHVAPRLVIDIIIIIIIIFVRGKYDILLA
jgi:hypothetical protein